MKNGNLSLVLILSIILNVRMGMVNSLLPLFIKGLGATVFEVGFLLSLSNFISVFMPVLGGLISDNYGRRTSILVSVLISLFPPLFYTFLISWKQLIPWILLYSVGDSLFWPARTAIVADYTHRRRAMTYGIINLALPFGSFLGPAFGGFLVDSFGWEKMFYTVVLLSSFSLLPTFFLTNSHVFECKGSIISSLKFEKKFVYPVIVFTLLNVFLHLGLGVVNPIIPIYLSQSFQLSMTEVGLFFSISQGISGVIGNLSGGWIADKFSRKRLLLVCALIIPFLMSMWPLMNFYFELILVWMVFWGLRSMMLPSRTAFLMDTIPSASRGLASGITMIGGRVGMGIGTNVGGFLCETQGFSKPFYWSAFLWGLCIPTIILLKEKTIANYNS